MTAIASLHLPDPQVLIARARKARDARTASLLLSDLMRTGLTTLHHNGGQIVQPWFDPAVAWPARRASFPNKAVAAFPATETAVTALAATEDAIRARFRALTDAVHQFMVDHGTVPDPEAWEAQRQTFPEVLWVVAGSDDPEDARQQAEQLSWARKRVRDQLRLAPEGVGRGVPGCTLCGQRQAVIPGGDEVGRLARARPRDVRASEALCTVCLAVRFAFPAGHFGPEGGFGVRSVTEVAAAPWLSTVDRDDPTVSDFLAVVAEVGWLDGPTTLEGALEAVYGVDPPAGTDQDALAIIADERSRLLRALGSPPDRYALVAFDGDRLGDHFRAAGTAGARLASSRALAEFCAFDAAEVVESSAGSGQLLYAGGDDGRFLAPAAHAISIARDLRRRMAARLPGVTISAGVVVADVRHPLDLVIESAVGTLKTAKAEYGRDAFAVSWLTGSGSRVAGGRFLDTAGNDLVDDLALVSQDFGSKALSRSLPATLQALAEDFDGAPGAPPAPDPVFADLAWERLLVMRDHEVASMSVVARWLDTLPPRRAAGLLRLARDLATVAQ